MAIQNDTKNMYSTVMSIQTMDIDCINKARELFEEFKIRGIIIDGEFLDPKWLCSDEYSHVGIAFNVNKFSYVRNYEYCFDLPYDVFIEYLKSYLLFNMGDSVLKSLQNVVNDVKRFVKSNDLYEFTKEVSLKHPNKLIEFFSILPESNNPEKVERILDALEDISDKNYMNSSSNKRMLASFDSYFLFHDIINDYWKSDIQEDERLFFYPLYLWWQITGVLPLRPREFILTPRKCLEQKVDGWHLTLRKSNIKGSKKNISYKIDEDYFTVQYKIPDKLAEEILHYIDLTKKHESTELDTLFITETHYQKWNKNKYSKSRYFTYVNLNCVVKYFFNNIIKERYGLRVIYARDIQHLEEGCINYLYLGDTRHLAMINIIADGGNPVVAMMLAGHDSIDMSSHYYSNITSLIKCRTYKQYRKVLKGNITYEMSKKGHLPLNIKDYVSLEDGGRCYSQAFHKYNFSDCKKISGPEGEIGYCPQCTFYRKRSKKDFFTGDDIYKRRIEVDCIHLAQVVKMVRQQKGNSEDIFQAMLRLQHSSYTYQQYCDEKVNIKKEINDGKKTKN